MTDYRRLHRWFSIPLALFFAAIAVTGIALQADMWISGNSPPGSEPEGPPPPTTDSATVRDAFNLAIDRVEAEGRGAAISSVTLDVGRGQTAIALGEGEQLLVSLADGSVMPPPPAAEASWHYILQDIHAGYFLGTTGRIVSTIAGLVLLFLAITGFKVWWDIWRRRVGAGRKGLFWR